MSISIYNIESITRGGKRENCGCSYEKNFFSTSRHRCKCHHHSRISNDAICSSVKRKTNKNPQKTHSIKDICDFWRNLLLNIKSQRKNKIEKLIYIAFPFQTSKDEQIWLCCHRQGRWVSLSSLFLATYQVSDRS